jgi:hypothetical protein
VIIYFGWYLKITEVKHIFELLSYHGHVYTLILIKMGWAKFWAIFSQTHLVTLLWNFLPRLSLDKSDGFFNPFLENVWTVLFQFILVSGCNVPKRLQKSDGGNFGFEDTYTWRNKTIVRTKGTLGATFQSKIQFQISSMVGNFVFVIFCYFYT